jgi:hypothetical protein
MVATIKVSGLRELQGALKAAENATPKMLRLALNEAAEVVLDYARPQVPSKSGAARGSMKVRSTQREARVAAGGRKAPYYPWLDFGGAVGKGSSVKRSFYREGRYIYPTLRKKHPEIIEAMGKALAGVVLEAGLEVI